MVDNGGWEGGNGGLEGIGGVVAMFQIYLGLASGRYPTHPRAPSLTKSLSLKINKWLTTLRVTMLGCIWHCRCHRADNGLVMGGMAGAVVAMFVDHAGTGGELTRQPGTKHLPETTSTQ